MSVVKLTLPVFVFLADNDQAAPEAPADPVPKPPAVAASDPDEVDISEHFYSPAAARLAAQQQQQQQHAMPSPAAGGFPGLPADMTEEQQAQLRQMMLGGAPPGAEGVPGAGEDPLMKMMAQMMGGGAGGGFRGMPGAGGPNAAASPFAGMMGAQQSTSSGPDVYSTVWRVVHALLALGLGLYIALVTPFNGTKIQRQLAFALADGQAADALYEKTTTTTAAAAADYEMLGAAGLDVARKNFFWAFATAEAVLLTTKFFLDKGRAPPPGFIWSMAGQLPMPWRGYVVSIMRYGQIFTTVRTDILLCAFVLGVCAWWRGQL